MLFNSLVLMPIVFCMFSRAVQACQNIKKFFTDSIGLASGGPLTLNNGRVEGRQKRYTPHPTSNNEGFYIYDLNKSAKNIVSQNLETKTFICIYIYIHRERERDRSKHTFLLMYNRISWLGSSISTASDSLGRRCLARRNGQSIQLAFGGGWKCAPCLRDLFVGVLYQLLQYAFGGALFGLDVDGFEGKAQADTFLPFTLDRIQTVAKFGMQAFEI